ncbi:mechanosensitive ion channel family protein [Paracrocinitomix mangrovi]|uniref:mechanosensitive ion channel family protein n=1 Tax=Paracrocinitomix mangrovi TaxID=2862509 RepID=UPI001C8E74CF|nr:mechanosensitive ion channel family protein [Paracrocinitomix mangrovi]UKN01268.1 mechanosensitive ion channel family protein [Paracrocinitomix mangrovi]
MLDIIVDKLESWWTSLVDLLPNFILALVVLVLFIIAARYIKKGLTKLFSKTYSNKELSKILTKIGYIAVIATGTMVALSILHLDKAVTSVLAGAGIVGLALSFAFQDLAANLISGFFMAAKRPFEVGDVIEIKDHLGTVKDIQLRSTIVETFDGNEVRIPNRILFENPLTNYYETKTRMIQLKVGVSYADDLEKVEEVAKSAITSLDGLVESEEVKLIYTGFDDSSINLEIRYWVPYDNYFQYLEGISKGIKAIKKAFDKNDISIPFPIRTLNFGIKGGESLEEQYLDMYEKLDK